jgi:hypothetical protein
VTWRNTPIVGPRGGQRPPRGDTAGGSRTQSPAGGGYDGRDRRAAPHPLSANCGAPAHGTFQPRRAYRPATDPYTLARPDLRTPHAGAQRCDPRSNRTCAHAHFGAGGCGSFDGLPDSARWRQRSRGCRPLRLRARWRARAPGRHRSPGQVAGRHGGGPPVSIPGRGQPSAPGGSHTSGSSGSHSVAGDVARPAATTARRLRRPTRRPHRRSS